LGELGTEDVEKRFSRRRKRRETMESRKIQTKLTVLAFFFAAVSSLLIFSSYACAGGVDIHVRIGLPFPGYVVGPPVVVYPAAPPVVVYERPVVVIQPPRKSYRPYDYRHRYHPRADKAYYRNARHHRHHDCR
jgi:hypothetical protein